MAELMRPPPLGPKPGVWAAPVRPPSLQRYGTPVKTWKPRWRPGPAGSPNRLLNPDEVGSEPWSEKPA